MKRKAGILLIIVLISCLAVPLFTEAHPTPCNVITVWPEGWEFHYQDGHTSKGAYPTVAETGEKLICIQPHVNTTSGPREQWTSLAQYFGNDEEFANRLSLAAYYSTNSGWGEEGIAVAQSLIWKYIMERNGEVGEQWLSTAQITDREQMQFYYDRVEEQIQAYLNLPEFHGKEVMAEAGESITVTDTQGVLKDMEVVQTEGPIRVSCDGNDLIITSIGNKASSASIKLEKKLPSGIEGNNFVYYSEGYQDVITIGFYKPLQAVLNVKIIPAKTEVEISKKSADSKEELAGASLSITDEAGKQVDTWITAGDPHRMKGLTVGDVYTLTEDEPAPGYATAEAITFIAEKNMRPVVMEDEIIRVQISKTDVTGEKELSGAKLQITDEDGTVVETWVSDGNVHLIEGLQAGRTYILTEQYPAPGYASAEAVSFVVQDTGKVQVVQMRDEITKTEIRKAESGTEKLLSGAVLQLLDENGNLVEEWISGEESHYIEGLTAGNVYTLTEKTAPDGYLRAPNQTFTVQDTGEVQQVVMEDEKARIKVIADKEAEEQVKAGESCRFVITKIENASNTELDLFTATDWLPEHGEIRELRTGTFSQSLTYKITYQTSRSEEWKILAEHLDSQTNHTLSFSGVPLELGERITAFRYEFGTVSKGFSIGDTEPKYWMEILSDIPDGTSLINRIEVSGRWNGRLYTDEKETETKVHREPDVEKGVPTGDKKKPILIAGFMVISGTGLWMLFRKERKTR